MDSLLAGDDHWWIILCVRPENDPNQASPSSTSRVKLTGEVLLWLALGIPVALFVILCCIGCMFRLIDQEYWNPPVSP
ncbi:hypothetical protein [Dactylosporangium sp. NPDC051484]|uniref:hypothetical protein n=1 Tax=Dactylosporangium sp. NPDC051484 TaxID=3154942 RepID=UPI0034508DDC